MMFAVAFLSLFLLQACLFASALQTPMTRRTSIVTGANGYVGREIVHALLSHDDDSRVICLVRPEHLENTELMESWKNERITAMPYDMLDGGESISSALESAYDDCEECCVYHVASVFGPTKDHKQTALDNVKGTEDLVTTIAKFPGCKLVLTSSMAAVRGTGQTPSNGDCYTNEDWNTESKLGDNWGSSYQWSKAESERRAWELSQAKNVPMVSLCPSFVFGPPRGGGMTSSYSISLVGQWVRGESDVQSRLCCDVRDVALAHVAAGTNPAAIGSRYIVSAERRVPSEVMAEALKKVCKDTGLGRPEAVTYDADFQGGAIPIGEREVLSTDRLEKELNVKLRTVEETIADMGRSLLIISSQEPVGSMTAN